MSHQVKHASKGSRASYALFHDQGKGAGSLLRCTETSKCDREVERDSALLASGTQGRVDRTTAGGAPAAMVKTCI